MQVGILNSKLRNTVITTAVVNDIILPIILFIIVQLAADGAISQINVGDIIVIGFNITVLLGGIFLLDIILRKNAGLLRRKVDPFFNKLQTEQAFGVLLITAIAISLIAQDIGLHFVIGTSIPGQ
jgi:Kef-type K+ transport system membrane component KefB